VRLVVVVAVVVVVLLLLYIRPSLTALGDRDLHLGLAHYTPPLEHVALSGALRLGRKGRETVFGLELLRRTHAGCLRLVALDGLGGVRIKPLGDAHLLLLVLAIGGVGYGEAVRR